MPETAGQLHSLQAEIQSNDHNIAEVFLLIVSPCEDELARFDRCHQKEVDYASGAVLSSMIQNNPSLFKEMAVSETYEKYLPTPTPLQFHR